MYTNKENYFVKQLDFYSTICFNVYMLKKVLKYFTNKQPKKELKMDLEIATTDKQKDEFNFVDQAEADSDFKKLTPDQKDELTKKYLLQLKKNKVKQKEYAIKMQKKRYCRFVKYIPNNAQIKEKLISFTNKLIDEYEKKRG